MRPDGNEVVQLLATEIGDKAALIAVLQSRLRLAEERIEELTAPQPSATAANGASSSSKIVDPYDRSPA